MLDDLLDIFDRDPHRSSTRRPKRGPRGVLARLLGDHDDDPRDRRAHRDADRDDEMRSERSTRSHDSFD